MSYHDKITLEDLSIEVEDIEEFERQAIRNPEHDLLKSGGK